MSEDESLTDERRRSRAQLRRELREQDWVDHDDQLVDALLDLTEVFAEPSPWDVYHQNDRRGTDRSFSLWMLLTGTVTLTRNSHRIRVLRPGECFGEFPLLDPRIDALTVTARAHADARVGRLSEEHFYALADTHPAIGQKLARMLVRRFVAQHVMYRPPNDRPRIFIGSSTEASKVAERLKTILLKADFEVAVWYDGVFAPSGTTIESLLAETEKADFAVFIASADDAVERRGSEGLVPWDNVIFELGLFMGALGRSRTFFVQAQNAPAVLPSDLLGVTALRYDTISPPRADDGAKLPDVPVLEPLAASIEELVNEMGPLTRLVKNPRP